MNSFASVDPEVGAAEVPHKGMAPEINQTEFISSSLLSKQSLLGTKPALGGVVESCDTSPWSCHTLVTPPRRGARSFPWEHRQCQPREGLWPWLNGPDTNEIISCGKSHVWEQLLCFQGDWSARNDQRCFHRATVPRILCGHQAGHGGGQRSILPPRLARLRSPSLTWPKGAAPGWDFLPWLPTGVEHPWFCTCTEAQMGFT